MKYYIRTGYNGLPLDRFIHTFRNSPGSPFREISIPSCCNPDYRIIHYSTLDWEDSGGLCAYSSVSIVIDGVPFLGDPLAPTVVGVPFPTTQDFIDAFNAKFGEKLLFTFVSGIRFTITVLVDFEEFNFLTTVSCTDPN